MEPTGAAPLRPTDLREIGPYRLLGRLGEGGMGTVFLARAPTGRFVAVKVVKAEFANTEGFTARFHAEVENARRVASFCTAQVLDNGNTGDGRPYMVTEYIGGTPLSDQITKYGALDPGPLHGVALGVAAALAAIHVAGLVHRDLKPANVILSISGPRVIDFGIARALDRETGFTVSGELLGSPGWWAPEQVRGEAVSPAVDIFAWGCLIAYAGNGRHPFGRGDPITLATRVLNHPPDLGALPAPLDELVRRATDMDPLQRPTAQDLLIALVGGGAATPVPVADPPTLVANELLNEWQPPQNVVNKPDITATYATPPPSDTAAKAEAKRQADEAILWEAAARVQEGQEAREGLGLLGGRFKRKKDQARQAEQSRPAGPPAGQSGSPAQGRPTGQPGPAGPDRPTAQPGPQGQSFPTAQPGPQGQSLPPGQPGPQGQSLPAGPSGPQGQSAPVGQSPQDDSSQPTTQSRLAEQSRVTEQSRPPGQGSPTGQSRPTEQGRPTGPGLPAGPGRPAEQTRQAEQTRAGEQSRPATQGPQWEPQDRQRGLQDRQQPQDRRQEPQDVAAQFQLAEHTSPDQRLDVENTLPPYRRSLSSRWLIAAAAAVLAIAVTVGVLIVTSSRNSPIVAQATGGPAPSASARPNDVGRRFPMGDAFDAPQVIVASAPECGLKQYGEQRQTQGQFCVVRWTMFNPGGERAEIGNPVVSLLDDKGGRHDPVEPAFPAVIVPGERVDSAFVFDMPLLRTPVRLTVTNLKGGAQLEVQL